MRCRKGEGVNIFQAVKENVTTRQAAEYYGLWVKPGGMACCPFHEDSNLSINQLVTVYKKTFNESIYLLEKRPKRVV